MLSFSVQSSAFEILHVLNDFFIISSGRKGSQSSSRKGSVSGCCLYTVCWDTYRKATFFLEVNGSVRLRLELYSFIHASGNHEPFELDSLLLQILWKSLRKCCLGAKADGMAPFPLLATTRRSFELFISAQLLGFQQQKKSAIGNSCKE